MKRVQYILFFLFITGPLQAQEFSAPSSWQKVASSQYDEISEISIRGNWITWMESRLDKSSQGHVALRFYRGLYRKKVDSKKIETLLEPNTSYTSANFITSKEGVTSFNKRFHFFPKHPHGFDVLDTQKCFPTHPIGSISVLCFYSDVIIFTEYFRRELCIAPFHNLQVDINQKTIIDTFSISPHLKGIAYDGRYIAYSKGQRAEFLHIYDNKFKKKIITLNIDHNLVSFSHIYLKDGYIYFILSPNGRQRGFPTGELHRLSINNMKLERLGLPHPWIYLIDFSPERILGIYKTGNNKYDILETDLVSHNTTMYDFPVPPASIGRDGHAMVQEISFGFDIYSDDPLSSTRKYSSGQQIRLFGDALTGKVLACYDNTLYLVPKIKSSCQSWKSSEWSSDIRKEVKQKLSVTSHSN